MPVKVAVIGAGYWGPNIIRTLMETRDAELITIADYRTSQLEPFSRRYPAVRLTQDYVTVLNDPEVNAVCIATPVQTHHRLVIEALQSGKHVFVEKPMTTTVPNAEQMVKAAKVMKKKLMVGHTFLYNPAVMNVHRRIEDGELGKVYYISGQRVNLGLHHTDINVLWDLAPHDISILLYWLKEQPEWVQCLGACYTQAGIEDVVFLTMGFPSGVVANLHLSWLAPSKMRQMTVIGSEKMLVYDDVSATEKVRIYDHGVLNMTREESEVRRLYRSGDIVSPHITNTEPLQNEMQYFIDCINYDIEPRSSGRQGLQVVQILDKAMYSLLSGGERVLV